MVELLEHSFPGAPMNLALEEVLLAPFSQRETPALLRVWHNQAPCIILGRSEKPEVQVDTGLAASRHIPIFRRTSGGGTVLHGPGNINLSFFLPYSRHQDLKSIKRSYALILGWVCDALEKSCGVRARLHGDSDLAVAGRKISGTAQARKRFGLLHHMTLLLDDSLLPLLDLLKEPQRRPEYRGQRTHGEFVTSLAAQGCHSFPQEEFLQLLGKSLGGLMQRQITPEEASSAHELAISKYSSDNWNIRGDVPISA